MRHLLSILFIFLTNSLFAQSSDLQIKLYGFEEGLSHRNVFTIQQDTFGFIWLATVNGLNKYDGYRFVHFRQDDEQHPLPHSFIGDMALATNNRLWLAHPNALSVLQLHTGNYQEIVLNEDNNRGEEKTPHNLYIDQLGRIWMATFSQKTGHSQLQMVTGKGVKTVLDLPGKNEEHAILQEGNFLYVAANENELWQLDLKGNFINKFSFAFPGDNPAFSRIMDLKRSNDGRFYVLLDNGQIYLKKPHEATFQPHQSTQLLYKNSTCTTFFVEKNGDVWLGGLGQLWHYDAQKKQLTDLNAGIQETTKHPPTYRHIFQDKSGVIWVASDFGAIKIARSNKLFETYLSGGDEHCSSGFCSMRGMTEDTSGNVYFAYYNAIHKLELETGNLTPLFPRKDFVNEPFGLQYADGALWTGNGLRIDLKSQRIDSLFRTTEEAEGIVILEDEQHLLFGHQNQLIRYNIEEKTSQNLVNTTTWPDTASLRINYLHIGQRSGYLWVATQEHGLLQLDSLGTIIGHFQVRNNSRNSLTNNRLLAIYEDNNGNVWLASANGLNRLDLVQNSVRAYNMTNGLPNNFINGILPDGDSILWLSTDKGLSRFQIAENNFENFFKQDGLPANEFNRIAFLKTKSGRIFFGGLNGVTSFLPSENFLEKKEAKAGKILFTSFSKFDGYTDSLIQWTMGISEDSMLKLSWRDKFFNFNFALADYSNPRENHYTYKLEGYDSDWSAPTHVNHARYNNLPAGSYIFRVRGAAGNEDWHPDELRVPILIEEPFYKKMWFVLSILGLVICAVYGVMRYRLHLIRLRQKILEKQVSKRTKELEEANEKSEALLLNILPAEIAEELKANGKARARRHEQTSVLFTDFQGFTSIAERMQPEDLVEEIDVCFRAFDEIIERHGLEKIKTIGDAYMCVGGIPSSNENMAIKTVKAALEMQAFMKKYGEKQAALNKPYFKARLGIHSGPVVGGIVGIRKFAYDIWGDTVNIASRMESHGEVGKVNISETTYSLVNNHFTCTYRGAFEVRGKGKVDMYFVDEVVGNQS